MARSYPTTFPRRGGAAGGIECEPAFSTVSDETSLRQATLDATITVLRRDRDGLMPWRRSCKTGTGWWKKRRTSSAGSRSETRSCSNKTRESICWSKSFDAWMNRLLRVPILGRCQGPFRTTTCRRECESCSFATGGSKSKKAGKSTNRSEKRSPHHDADQKSARSAHSVNRPRKTPPITKHA